MPLLEHLRELRTRLFRSALAVFVFTVVAFIFYEQIFDVLRQPFDDGIAQLAAEQDINAELTLSGIGSAFTLQLTICVVAGVVAASPVWLWQAWAFVVPALRQTERKWSLVFAAVAGPLFILGVAIGYYVLPKAISVLIGFTPDNLANLVDSAGYFSFVLRMLLVFGVAFEIPLFVLMLNLAGVVSGRKLGEVRPFIIIGTFLFAAVATPSTDPITMLFLALPMTFLFLTSEVLARLFDRRKGKVSYAQFDDDAVSDLEVERYADDEVASDLGDDRWDDDDWDDEDPSTPR